MNKLRSAIVVTLLVPLGSSCQGNRNEQAIEVTSMTTNVDERNADQEICKSFMLTSEDVVIYFSIAEEVDEYRFNQEAVILPCKYNGTIKIRGDSLQWEISAGGVGYLYRNREVNKRFLCTENCCEAFPNMC